MDHIAKQTTTYKPYGKGSLRCRKVWNSLMPWPKYKVSFVFEKVTVIIGGLFNNIQITA